MKKRNLFLVALFALILSSCFPTSYFQVYKVKPTDKTTLYGNNMIYEDENCKVFYNLWNDGGNIGFRFYNKTDKNIYLNLEESFFILNGMANNYFKNRIYTNSSSTAASSALSSSVNKSLLGLSSVGIASSSGSSISYNEEKTVCIPGKTSKVVAEYSINSALYRDCDLFKYPTKKQINTKFLSISDSPLVFSNRIVYSIGLSYEPIKFENEFYVTEITNYPEDLMIEWKYDEYCGQKSTERTKYFKHISPDMFYIQYNRKGSWIH
ncbi:hypothetical protein ACFLRR_01275 [Bacteroidota bacterium]